MAKAGARTARRARSSRSKGANGGLATILTGLGSLSYGELAGERMKLGLILHDPEEEHDCFSDNTHNSHYYDEVGMIAIYNGSYKAATARCRGSEPRGLCRRARRREAAKALDAAMRDTPGQAAARSRTAPTTASRPTTR